MHKLWLMVALVACTPPAVAETVATVRSPGGVLTASLELHEGRLGYRIERFGEPVIESSRLGFQLRGAEKLERNLALVSQATRSVDTTWEQPWGESRHVRDHHNELRARFTESINLKRTFDVVFRVFDDGVGFRYEFPQQANLGEVIIDDELTEFAVAAPATAWWIPAGEWNRYEYLYNRTPLAEVAQAHTPMTVRTEDGLHVAFHEAALVDYAGMWLRRTEGQRLRAQLSPASQGWKVRRTTPFHTPWRTLQIADSAGGLVESNLILNLNAPNVLGDVSWVRPSKYVGIWWSLHLDEQTWATGARHGATTANTRRYIDFAAKHGFRGVLVEGWNPGWDGNWFANGYGFDFTRATADFDLEGLSAYATGKGVHLVGHHETGCAVSHYEDQMEAAFAMNARLGIDSVKTGYVCDAGQIERRGEDGAIAREWHDGQWNVGHHQRVVEAAARHRVAINAHEPVKDTGLRRTYPNWISREGARGMEYAAWGEPPNPPEHEANLLFTRMLAGPMDYTPGILSLQGRGRAIQTTLAKQLALYVVLYSPIQMAADLPEHYERHLDAFQFIKDVPVDWAQTRVLNGEVGDYATVVRKDRDSEDWYLGSVTDEHGRLLSVPLSFLDPGRRYVAQVYRDGDRAHWKTARFDFERESREVSSSDTLALRLAAGGGQAIRFSPVATPVPTPAPIIPATPAPQPDPGPAAALVETLQLPAPAWSQAPLRVDVHLPPGYDPAAARRYPVLYLNDGQDTEAVALQPTLARLQAQGSIEPVIVVAIHMPADRMGAYGLSDRPTGRSLFADTRHGRVGALAHDYSEWVSKTLVPHIDNHYRTQPSPAARAILGWSLGGLNAFNLAWQYPELFGRIGAFSPSFWLSDDNSDPAAVQRTRLAQAMVDRSEPRKGLKLFFAVGGVEETDDRDGDGIIDVLDDALDLLQGHGTADKPQARGLAQLGYSINPDHAGHPGDAAATLFVLEGGKHQQASWARMLPVFLQWAYGRQAPTPAADTRASP